MIIKKISTIIPKWLKVGVLVVIPLVLLLLPANYFDEGQSICLSVLLFEQECMGCGMTRACMHLIHGDFHIAAQFNKLSFVVLPLLSLYWLHLFLVQFGKRTILDRFF